MGTTVNGGGASLPVWEEWIEMSAPIPISSSGRSLPVWEEWIEMCWKSRKRQRDGCLFPYGKSGLKSARLYGPTGRRGSLPVWEEWIEMNHWQCTNERSGLFPYGKSGLKSDRRALRGRAWGSLPVWEEWIEMLECVPGTRRSMSLPVWEEWIEIPFANSCRLSARSLFPYGKSGLK